MVNCLICPVFHKCIASTINKNDLKLFQNNVLKKNLKKGELIFSENQPADKIFMVINGEIKFSKEDGLPYSITMRIAHAGELIGLEALINEKYGMTASCFSNVFVCEFSRKQIDGIFKQQDDVCKNFVSELLKQVKHLNNYSLTMIAGSASAKISLALLSLASNKTIKASKEEIALMTGSSRETVSRILSKLKKENIIHIDKNTIVITNREELLLRTKKTKRKLNQQE